MTTPLQSLVATGTKLWLDSIDPDLVARRSRARAPPGPRPIPIIISDLLKTGPVRQTDLDDLIAQQLDGRADRLANDRPIGAPGAGRFSARLARDQRQRRLRQLRARSAAGGSPAGRRTPSASLRYIELGKKWAAGHHEPHDQDPGHAGRTRRHRAADCRRLDPERDADLLAAAVSGCPRRGLARRSEARSAERFQERLQHLRVACGRVHREARAATFRRGPRRSGHRRRQAHLGREPRILVR